MVSKVDTSISESIKDQLRLLKKYSSVISKHELDLGWTGLVTEEMLDLYGSFVVIRRLIKAR